MHADGIKGALVSTVALAGTRVPSVWLKCDFSHDGWLARSVARRCSSIAAVSRAVTETFRDGALEKTTVVPFGLPEAEVDREQARAAVRELTGGERVVGVVGRLDPHKGHGEVLAVLPRLRERHDVRALFVGADDPAHPGYRERLAAEIDAAGLGGAVAMPGFRADAIELIAGCDALVIPSVTSRGGLGKEASRSSPWRRSASERPSWPTAMGGRPRCSATAASWCLRAAVRHSPERFCACSRTTSCARGWRSAAAAGPASASRSRR